MVRLALSVIACISCAAAAYKQGPLSDADLLNLHAKRFEKQVRAAEGVTTMLRIKETSCSQTAAPLVSKLRSGSHIQVVCPASCSTNIRPTHQGWAVYGLGPFRVDSAICRAAFIAGVIGSRGGRATLVYAGVFPEFIPFGAMMRSTFCFKGMNRPCIFNRKKMLTRKPTFVPTRRPTRSPTLAPTPMPSLTPTEPPTPTPSVTPTELPSTRPPSPSPSHTPSEVPTADPTITPTEPPTPKPTRVPTQLPSTPGPTVLKVLTGYVKNGVNGRGIAGAIVRFTAGSNAGRQATADKNGKYRLTLGAGGGLSTITVSGLSAFENSTETMRMTSSLTRYDVDLSPKLAKGEFRVIFSWGKAPKDLDIWMTTPDPKCTVGYRKKRCKTAFHHVGLDKDDTSGYGPETITILKQLPGLYKFYVHHYSGSGSLVQSGGIVKVFHKLSKYPFKVTQKTFKVGTDGRVVKGARRVPNPPKLPAWTTAQAVSGNYWSVFAYNSTSHQFATAPNLPHAHWTTPPNYASSYPTRRPTPVPTRI